MQAPLEGLGQYRSHARTGPWVKPPLPVILRRSHNYVGFGASRQQDWYRSLLAWVCPLRVDRLASWSDLPLRPPRLLRLCRAPSAPSIPFATRSLA